MRYSTRHYTTELPRIGLEFLGNIRRSLEDDEPGTHLYFQTESGRLCASKRAEGYAMTINGVTRSIRITATLAGYGFREWYVCPHCGARVAKLYIGEKDIACRKCWNLHYASQSEDRLGRMRMRIRRRRYAIWGNNEQTRNLFNRPDLFPKPKGMRWETFNQKVVELVRYEEACWRAFVPSIERVTGPIYRNT